MSETLNHALRRAADDDGLAPTASGEDLLRRARRRHKGHRIGYLALTASLLAAAAVGLGSVLPSASPQIVPAIQAPATPAPGADHILRQCALAENIPDEELPGNADMFGNGAAVITTDRSKHGVAAFILSPDGRFYAECSLGTGASVSWIHEYKAHSPAGGGVNTLYLGRRSFEYRDRFPSEVARVDIELCNGSVTSAHTVNGFVAFNRAAAADPCRLRLYDANGRKLAASDFGSLPARYDSLLPSARR